MAVLCPEAGQQTRLPTVIGAAHAAAKEHESAVVLSRPKHLPRVPRKGGAVERHENEPRLGARYQQCDIVEAKPRSVLPARDMHDGKCANKAVAGRHQPV